MRQRLGSYRLKILEELRKAFDEEHSSREIAFSFSIGIFIATLPTMGTGLLLFLVMMKLSQRISNLALMASVVVMNPFIKPVFYLAGINLGSLIMTGSIVATADPVTVITYLVVGSLAIASVIAVISYFVVLKAVRRYRKEDLHVVKEIEDKITEEID